MGVNVKKKCWRYVTRYICCASNPDMAHKIPKKIHRHIKKCSYCSKTVEQLLRYLAQQFASQQAGKSSTEKLSALARKHFEFLGRMVDCQTVKPFLPLLLGPHRDITIPTPITVHKAECDQCTEDYSLLSILDLTAEQVNKAAKFFSDPTHCHDSLDKDNKIDRLINDIADRENSDVITCYELAPVAWNKDNPNAPVDCKTLKTFLPQFAGNELELTIPSALTAHIAECYQCRSDLETITNLNLTTMQLTDLKEIFRADPQRTDINFSQAHQHIDAEKLEDQLNCEDIQPRSLFDHCFPHLTLRFRPEYEIIEKLYLTQKNDEDRKIDNHISKCRNCQARIQQLHKTISAIAQRGNTDVLTANDTPVPAQRPGFFDLDYQYANYPIKVWIKSCAETELRKNAQAEYDDYLKASTPSGIVKFLHDLRRKFFR
ncbi:hypothetical protein ACFL3G_04355 [Planctomycetota bacterium]